MVHTNKFSFRYIHNILNNQRDSDRKSPWTNQTKQKLSTTTITRCYYLSKLCFQQAKIQNSRTEVLCKNVLQNLCKIHRKTLVYFLKYSKKPRNHIARIIFGHYSFKTGLCKSAFSTFILGNYYFVCHYFMCFLSVMSFKFEVIF